mmetsp:Transcript_90249/g.156257  ORF Transcript_90249/g.156257 Transcript_90249/m.156257 type:complete len:131 (-) Transcript_90249:293-685(-)
MQQPVWAVRLLVELMPQCVLKVKRQYPKKQMKVREPEKPNMWAGVSVGCTLGTTPCTLGTTPRTLEATPYSRNHPWHPGDHPMYPEGKPISKGPAQVPCGGYGGNVSTLTLCLYQEVTISLALLPTWAIN